MKNQDSFGAASTLRVQGDEYTIYRLDALEKAGVAKLGRVPYSIRILLENLLRMEDGETVKRGDIEYVAQWKLDAPAREINFMPARVLLQDFTGVPCVVDLAAMRDALQAMGADPKLRQSADPGGPGDRPFRAGGRVRHARTRSTANALLEFQRNRERYMLPALGADGVSRISAWCRRIRASCTR